MKRLLLSSILVMLILPLNAKNRRTYTKNGKSNKIFYQKNPWIKGYPFKKRKKQNVIYKKTTKAKEKYKGTQRECPVCNNNRPENDFVLLHCNHAPCNNCINITIDDTIETKSTDRLRCPQCWEQLENQERYNLVNDEQANILKKIETKERFDRIAMQEGGKRCPTPDCLYAFVPENDEVKHHCPRCDHEYCSNCLEQHDEHISCADAEERRKENDKEKWEEEQKNKNYIKEQAKECPRCHSIIEKTSGCNHMTCNCRYVFCYRCGEGYENGSCGCNRNRISRDLIIPIKEPKKHVQQPVQQKKQIEPQPTHQVEPIKNHEHDLVQDTVAPQSKAATFLAFATIFYLIFKFF